MQVETQQSIPIHVGYIVDGNRRWAKKHGLPTYEGHLAGYETLKNIVVDTIEKGVKYVSIYVFSTENWRRSQDEVAYLMKLTLSAFKRDIGELIDRQIRVKVLGTKENISDKIKASIADVEERTADLTAGTVSVCFNYGGWQEITDAAKQCVSDGLESNQIDEAAIRARLYEPDIPDLDVVVRTSGEQRLSNFMLWRAAYSEFIFLDKLWPDLRPSDVDDILTEYNSRNRRFGGN